MGVRRLHDGVRVFDKVPRLQLEDTIRQNGAVHFVTSQQRVWQWHGVPTSQRHVQLHSM